MDSKREETLVQDKRITKLANDVSSAADSVVPRLLLQVQGILDSCGDDRLRLAAVKSHLWNYELYPIMLTALKQDFNKILDGWNTSVKLAQILVTCCTKWNPEDNEDFEKYFIPSTVSVLVTLANRLQKKVAKVSVVLEDTKKQLVANFCSILESITSMCYSYDQLIKFVLQSVGFLQMLLTDDVPTCLQIMSFLQISFRQKSGLFTSLDPKISNQILDELTYKLSVSSNLDTASAATRTLIVMCESYPPLVEQLCSRYKGLRLLLLSKQMGLGKVSNVDFQRLMLLLNMGNFQRAELEKVARAARVIQAWWKSYRTRHQIKKADTAIASLQRTFRHKKERENRRRQEEKMRSDLEHMLAVQRRFNMRQLHQRQLHTLDILPASAVAKHLANEQNRAAIKIQSLWKGYCVRHGIERRRDAVRRNKAAIRIQRMVRKWLEKIHVKKEEPVSWQRPAGLTDDRRVELQAKIQDWRESHTIERRNREQQEQLHYKVQDMLKCQVIGTKAARQHQQHNEALLARIDMDINFLLNAPRLCDVGDDINDLLKTFVCHPAAAAAKARHAEELRLLKQPWWRKLGDEYQDAETAIEDDEEEWRVF